MIKFLLVLSFIFYFPSFLFASPSALKSVYMEMLDISKMNKSIVTIERFGESSLSSPLYLLRLNASRKKLPKIYIDASQHGNESISTEGLMIVLRDLIKNKNKEEYKKFLAKYEIIFVPVANPDGFKLNKRFLQYKDGLDLNRDFPSKSIIKTPFLLSSEAKAIDKLFAKEEISYVFSFHSGINAVLWPYGYTRRPAKDEVLYKSLGHTLCRNMKIAQCSSIQEDYLTHGELIDYSYDYHKSISFVIEISSLQDQYPKQKDSELENRMNQFTKTLIETF